MSSWKICDLDRTVLENIQLHSMPPILFWQVQPNQTCWFRLCFITLLWLWGGHGVRARVCVCVHHSVWVLYSIGDIHFQFSVCGCVLGILGGASLCLNEYLCVQGVRSQLMIVAWWGTAKGLWTWGYKEPQHHCLQESVSARDTSINVSSIPLFVCACTRKCGDGQQTATATSTRRRHWATFLSECADWFWK